MYKIINNIYVQNFYIPKYENNDRTAYNNIKMSIGNNKNTDLRLDSLKKGEIITFGEATFKVLSA